ncbi:H/ACA ribonucleoprotein complex subunit 2-like protein, partial [Tanacetum coccineum]
NLNQGKENLDNLSLSRLQVCVIAENITPIDVIIHYLILWEANEISYVYVSSKEDLANAGATKRPTCCVLVLSKPTKGELGEDEQKKLKAEYDQLSAEVSALAASLF